MIRQPNDWDNIVAGEQRQQIPLGAYVCNILQAVIEDTQYGQVLKVSFDVAEGDQRGYYAADYRANTADDKKWAGVRTVFLPSYDGSEKDERNKRSLKGFCTSVEKSNPGFHCFTGGVMDERALKGKLIGVLMRNGTSTADAAGKSVRSSSSARIRCVPATSGFRKTSHCAGMRLLPRRSAAPTMS